VTSIYNQNQTSALLLVVVDFSYIFLQVKKALACRQEGAAGFPAAVSCIRLGKNLHCQAILDATSENFLDFFGHHTKSKSVRIVFSG
jgi:hypothetical protein